jgi:Gly-Xaa carboxypeptidase
MSATAASCRLILHRQRYGSDRHHSAVPAIAEKGGFDVRIDVHTPGGHSSIPPPHTSIGMLAQMLVKYEANPYSVSLQRGTPMYETIQCLAAHAPDLPRKLRHAIKHSAKSDRALKTAEKELFKVPGFKALTGTTQAIDLISGGVKSNALPEQAYAVVNHRIDTASSVGEVIKHNTKLLKPFAEKFNLSLVAFGTRLTDADAPSYGTLELSDAWGTALEPAPITPTDAAPYKLLAGTIKEVYASHRGGAPDQDINVAPGIMSGNTGRLFRSRYRCSGADWAVDTRYYWKLSDHIFRYNHHNAVGGRALGNVHTVNECTYCLPLRMNGADVSFSRSHLRRCVPRDSALLQHAHP